MENKLQINCSPGTFERVQNDEPYRQTVASQVLSNQEESYSEVIFTRNQTPEIAEGDKCDEHALREQVPSVAEILAAENEEVADISDEKQNWLEAPTKLMLSLIEELRPNVGKTPRLKTKSRMYKCISEKLVDAGYNFNPLQIENKFRGLERQYKKMVLNNKKTGRSRITCPYEKELEQILREKRGINPEYVLESGETEGASRSTNSLEETGSDTEKDDGPSCSKKPKKGPKEASGNKLQEFLEEKKKFHSEILELMKKKEERAQRNEEMAKKKLELLEKLVNQTSNANK